VQEQDEGMAADLCGFVKDGLPHLTGSLRQYNREKSYPPTEQNENVPVDMV
jgi:hypothetical protein